MAAEEREGKEVTPMSHDSLMYPGTRGISIPSPRRASVPFIFATLQIFNLGHKEFHCQAQ